MTRTKWFLIVAIVVAMARCAAPVAPPPVVAPAAEDRFLVDPRVGYTGPAAPAAVKKFDSAWRYVLGGNEAEARRILTEIRVKNPEYLPATLAEAALDLRLNRLEQAGGAVDLVLQRDPKYTAAQVYQAEIAMRQGQPRRAYELYRNISALPDAPPFTSERLENLRAILFNELYAAAQSAPDTEAIGELREALTFNPGSEEARILLAGKLLGQRQFDEARRELDPLLTGTAVDRNEVQQMLAEIDAGRGRYQEPIVPYDRLARRTKDPRYEKRLEEIKEEWSAANMPPQYRTAWESSALSRSDLAVLLYWLVPSVRFAQNLGTPPIAIDIEDVAGREEIIRAIALGIFDVDPVTRRVSPQRLVTAERLTRHLGRLLTVLGAPCARNSGAAHDDVTRARAILAACRVSDPLVTLPPDASVPGSEAKRAIEQVAAALQ